MNIEIATAVRALRGAVRVPGDKSIGHRALLCSAIARGRSRIARLSHGEDNRRTLTALRLLGISVEERAEECWIDGQGRFGLRPTLDGASIDCGNSGTTIRLLAGLLAPLPFATRLVGDRYLEERPMGRVADPLARMGATVTGRTRAESPGDLYPPLIVAGPARGRLRGIDYRSPRASAQVKSAILLAALAADGTTRVREPALSRDHSERMLRAQGAPLTVTQASEGPIIELAAWDGELDPLDLAVPGDLSSAAFLLGAAAVVPGSELLIEDVNLNPTRTGVIDALLAMGARLSVEETARVAGEPIGRIAIEQAPLHGIRIDGELALRSLDELPLLAAVAAHAEGETIIADARELRVKESDRIAAMVAALRALGFSAEERPDGLTLVGGVGRAAEVESRGDHRIAMATAVCALAVTGRTRVLAADNVATSFPGFVETLGGMGAEVT